MRSITVGIVHQGPVFRLGMATILDLMAVGSVVLEADGREQLEQRLTAGPVPSVLLLHLSGPLHHTVELLQWLGMYAPLVRVVVVGCKGADDAAGVLKAGARGIIWNQPSRDVLCDAVRTVATGRIYRAPQRPSA